jgi:hypothetical protein
MTSLSFLTGNATILANEIYRQKRYGNVFSQFRATGPTKTPGMINFTKIAVNETHSLMSLITMIFPSPDWFLGISNMDMCNKITGEWRKNYTRDLLPYDSGTDDGTSFESPDSATNPRKNIFLIGKDDETNFKSDSDIKRLGVLVIERVEENDDNNNGGDKGGNGDGGDDNGGDNGGNGDDDNNVNTASTFTRNSILVAITTVLIMFIIR